MRPHFGILAYNILLQLLHYRCRQLFGERDDETAPIKENIVISDFALETGVNEQTQKGLNVV